MVSPTGVLSMSSFASQTVQNWVRWAWPAFAQSLHRAKWSQHIATTTAHTSRPRTAVIISKPHHFQWTRTWWKPGCLAHNSMLIEPLEVIHKRLQEELHLLWVWGRWAGYYTRQKEVSWLIPSEMRREIKNFHDKYKWQRRESILLRAIHRRIHLSWGGRFAMLHDRASKEYILLLLL